jgi:hypothetical protein
MEDLLAIEIVISGVLAGAGAVAGLVATSFIHRIDEKMKKKEMFEQEFKKSLSEVLETTYAKVKFSSNDKENYKWQNDKSIISNNERQLLEQAAAIILQSRTDASKKDIKKNINVTLYREINQNDLEFIKKIMKHLDENDTVKDSRIQIKHETKINYGYAIAASERVKRERAIASAKQAALATDLLQKKAKDTVVAQLTLLAVVLTYFMVCLVSEFEPSVLLIGIFIIPVLASSFDIALAKYRIRRGWFGNNEAEARELLMFLNHDVPPDDKGKYDVVIDEEAFAERIDSRSGGQIIGRPA